MRVFNGYINLYKFTANLPQVKGSEITYNYALFLQFFHTIFHYIWVCFYVSGNIYKLRAGPGRENLDYFFVCFVKNIIAYLSMMHEYLFCLAWQNEPLAQLV